MSVLSTKKAKRLGLVTTLKIKLKIIEILKLKSVQSVSNMN